MQDLPEQLDPPDFSFNEEYLYSVLGSRYLGNGYVLCDYCLDEQVVFVDIHTDHICKSCSPLASASSPITFSPCCDELGVGFNFKE